MGAPARRARCWVYTAGRCRADVDSSAELVAEEVDGRKLHHDEAFSLVFSSVWSITRGP